MDTNPCLSALQPYPFEKLRVLYQGIEPPSGQSIINLGIGEPQHPVPDVVRQSLEGSVGGLSRYPSTLGLPSLRHTIAEWLKRRYSVESVDPDTQVLPVNGSREALFSFAQAILNPKQSALEAVVVCPNPFYQIYEGAALLAGVRPWYLPTSADWARVPAKVWKLTQLVFVCSPDNPTGRIQSLDRWRELFRLSDQYGFVIASDECYSEIYPSDHTPPLGALSAATLLGRTKFPRLVVFSSLSKRSSVPGLRSGFVAGDAELLRSFLLYRTYHGSAMGPMVQSISQSAWQDEEHVRENRRWYTKKFQAVVPLLSKVLTVTTPAAGFYLWVPVPKQMSHFRETLAGNKTKDEIFARSLYATQGVIVLPGSYLARDNSDGSGNPGNAYIRLSLTPPLVECMEAGSRIVQFCEGSAE